MIMFLFLLGLHNNNLALTLILFSVAVYFFIKKAPVWGLLGFFGF